MIKVNDTWSILVRDNNYIPCRMRGKKASNEAYLGSLAQCMDYIAKREISDRFDGLDCTLGEAVLIANRITDDFRKELVRIEKLLEVENGK